MELELHEFYFMAIHRPLLLSDLENYILSLIFRHFFNYILMQVKSRELREKQTVIIRNLLKAL